MPRNRMKRGSVPDATFGPSRTRGRPREFDIDEMAACAAQVFWKQGYHATSIETLCDATGLPRGSLYSAFGDKHGLLVAAFDSYAKDVVTQLREQLNSELPPREGLHQALLPYTHVATLPTERHGCFISNAALELLPTDEVMRQRIEATLQQMTTHLAAAVVRGKETGEFEAHLDGMAVGTFLLCVVQGLRVLGKMSVDEQQLRSVVGIAMRALA